MSDAFRAFLGSREIDGAHSSEWCLARSGFS